jgi:ribosomal protein S18 acetylase RimI-like enzyme
MKTYVRKLTSHDYKSVKDIYELEFGKKGFTNSELHKQWKYRDASKSLGIYNHTKELLGFVLSDGNFIPFIAVHPKFHKLGLGTKLIKVLLRKHYFDRESVYLYPMEQSDKLFNWYYDLGFHYISRGFMLFHHYNIRHRKYTMEWIRKETSEINGPS